MRIVITGAAGRIGREILEELFHSHDLYLVDRSPVPGYETIITDLSQYEGKTKFNSSQETVPKLWTDAFRKAEIVIHLAEEHHANASWKRVFQNNITATWNVFQACAQHHVRRVIYGSSNWVVKALELELAPACYEPDGPKIGSWANPRPVNPYGIGKVFGETTGRILVDDKRISSFAALRIGWFTPNPPNNADYRRRALGSQDLRSLFRRCVDAEFDGFHIIYGVSGQKISPYDISYTTRLLSWEPKETSLQEYSIKHSQGWKPLSHLIFYRDCRDITNSPSERIYTVWRNKKWVKGFDTAEKVAKRCVLAIELIERNSDRLYTIRYENLVNHPEEALMSLGRQLGVDPSSFPKEIIRDDSIGKHRTVLADKELEDIMKIAGPTMARLNLSDD